MTTAPTSLARTWRPSSRLNGVIVGVLALVLAYVIIAIGAKDGWAGPTVEIGLPKSLTMILGAMKGLSVKLDREEYCQWTRDAVVGYRAGEKQKLMMQFGNSRLAKQVPGGKVPAGYCVVRVWTTAMAMERFEFPQQ